jgi:hypothetical protein
MSLKDNMTAANPIYSALKIVLTTIRSHALQVLIEFAFDGPSHHNYDRSIFARDKIFAGQVNGKRHV